MATLFKKIFGVLLCLGVWVGPALFVGCDDETDATRYEAKVIVEPQLSGNAPFTAQLRVASNAPIDGVYAYRWQFGDGAESTESEPTHRWESAGDYLISVSFDVGGAVVRAEQTIEVLAPADLQVGEINFSPQRASPGQDVEVAFSVRNEGAPALGVYRMLLVLSEQPELTSEAIVLEESLLQDDPTPADSGQRTVRLPQTLPSGEYYFGVAIDPEGKIGDAQRDNNVRFADTPLRVHNPTDSGPDLTICGFSVPALDDLPADQPAVVQLGDQLAVSVCLANIGNRPTASASYAIQLVSEGDPSRVLDLGQRAQIVLGADERETFEDLVDLPVQGAQGDWSIQVVADPEDELAEQREDNNARRRSGLLKLVAPNEIEGVDLAITALSVEGARVRWGQALSGRLTLNNWGDTPVNRAFVVRLFAVPLDGREAIQIGALNLSEFGARAQEHFDVQLTISQRIPEGRYRLRAQVSLGNAIVDVNPSNNERTLQEILELGGVADFDLSVASVRFSPLQVDAGQPLSVQAALSNVGVDPSGSFEVAVVLSADQQLDPQDPVLGQWNLPSIEPGQTTDFEESVEVPRALDQQVERWWVGVWVDPNRRLSGEQIAENNTAIAPTQLEVRGATGGCAEDDLYEPNNARDEAASLTAEHTGEHGLCDGQDWFAVPLQSGEGLHVRATERLGGEALKLWVFDQDGELLAQGEGLFDGARAATILPSAAERTVYLQLTSAQQLQYELQLEAITLTAEANLRPRHLQLSPRIVEPGATVHVRAEALNLGLAQAPPSRASLRLLSEEGNQVSALGELAVGAIEGGAFEAIEQTIELSQALPDGRYIVQLQLDILNQVAEADEQDNRLEAWLDVNAQSACPHDAFEPNYSPFEGEHAEGLAASLSPGSHEDLYACQGQDDWYALELTQGKQLQAEIHFDHAQGDLELTLYGPDGQTHLAQSQGFSDVERIDLPRILTGGRHYLRVFLNPLDGENLANRYTLSLRVDDATACADDAHEPNNTRAEARSLPDGSHDLVLCPSDEDWFRFNLAADNVVSFQVQSEGQGVEMTLFDPTGAQVAADTRRITHQARLSGPYALRFHSDRAQRQPYVLSVMGVNGLDLEVSSVQLSGAVLSPNEGFRVETVVSNLRGESARNVPIRYALAAGAQPSGADLRLHDEVIPLVEGGAQLPLSQRLRVPPQVTPGLYQVMVQIDPQLTLPDLRPDNNYRSAPLEVVAACVDDDDRSNEGPSTAQPLDAELGLYEGVICPFTEDWFVLADVPVGLVGVQLDFAAQAGDLDLYVYGAAVNPLAESATANAPERVDFLHQGGDLLIRVDGFLDAQNEYTLSWTLPAPPEAP